MKNNNQEEILMINLKNALQSLASIKKVDEYGMFQMTYFGDYGFDEFLKVGAKSDAEIEAFMSKHLFSDISLDIKGAGCTAFIARNSKNEVLFCRNFDFPYSPSVQLFTSPGTGYASVSTVNLMYLGFNQDYLPSGLDINSFATVISPYLPMDGANEKGVAIAILGVPEAAPPFDENKVTINTTAAIRLVLDKATDIDEAIKLLKQYNLYFSYGITFQLFIADASGKSVIINYYDNDIKVTESLIASNFIPYNGLNIPEGGDEFERYDRVKEALEANGGVLSENQAIDLLIEVASKKAKGLQWSVVHNLSTMEGIIFAGGKRDNLINFSIKGNLT